MHDMLYIYPFWAGYGRGVIQTLTPWFIATGSTPLSYKPHLISPGVPLEEGTFPLLVVS
uniref:14-3-3 protein 1 n=1 Tax=Solanum tuberosum TaxID=4113 RepID=M1BBN8_SOLTU